MTVTKGSETVRVKSHFIHTVNYLKKLGVPANNSVQVRNSRTDIADGKYRKLMID